jgi:hypothetical protein
VKSKFAPMASPGQALAPAPAAPAARPMSAAKPAAAMAPASAPTSAPVSAPAAAPAGPLKLNTVVMKGPHGIGLDISKGPDGRTVVQRFKELPDGAVNPAKHCTPPICPGDVIAGVNGVVCNTFMEAVKLIKGSSDRVTLSIERS